MIPGHGKTGPSGQALVEFVIVLPLLLLLVSAILPLVRFGAFSPWLDERLWLTQFFGPEGALQSELSHAHEKSLVPEYFSGKDLSREEDSEAFGIFLPPLDRYFPGSFHVDRIQAALEATSVPFTDDSRFPKNISKEFSMIKRCAIPEKQVPSRIRKMSLLHSLKGSVNLPGDFRVDLFHLNLDILPDRERKEK